MAHPILNSQLQFLIGEVKPIAIKIWSEANPNTDLSGGSATVTVYNATGSITLTSGAATLSGTTLLSVSRIWDTTSVSPGAYRAVITYTSADSSTKTSWQLPIIVLPTPAP